MDTVTAREPAPALISDETRDRLIGSMRNRLHIVARLGGWKPEDVIAEFDRQYELCLRCGLWRRRDGQP